MTQAQFAGLGAPVIQLFLMPFWRPLVYVNDTREIEDLLGPGSVKLVANGNGHRNGR